MIDKYINNIYDKLLDEITISTYISLYRGDIESTAHGIIYNDRISKSALKKIDSNLMDFVIQKEPKLDNICVFLLTILYGNKIDLSRETYNDIKKTLEDIRENQIFPIGQKSHVNYLLSESKLIRFEEQHQCLSDDLEKKADSFFKAGDIEAGILASYSLENVKFISFHVSFCQEFIKEHRSNVDGLARCSVFIKSVLYLARQNCQFEKIGAKAELLLSRTLKTDKSPDLWFAISESERIINSNLEPNVTHEIINILRDSGHQWSKLVDDIQGESITVNIKNSIKFSPPSVVDAYYAIQLIEALDRDHVFSIPYNKIDEFNRYVTRSEVSTDYKSGFTLLMFLVIISITITSIVFISDDFTDYMSDFYEKKVNPKSIKTILNFLSNPISIIILLLWWVYLVLSEVSSVYSVSVKGILLKNPIIIYIKKFFNITKPKQ